MDMVLNLTIMKKTHNVKRYLFHFVGLIYIFGRDAKEHAYLLIIGNWSENHPQPFWVSCIFHVYIVTCNFY